MARQRELLTVSALCDELEVSRSTFYKWKAKGNVPPLKRLPNGEIRVRRCDLELWLDNCGEAA